MTIECPSWSSRRKTNNQHVRKPRASSLHHRPARCVGLNPSGAPSRNRRDRFRQSRTIRKILRSRKRGKDRTTTEEQLAERYSKIPPKHEHKLEECFQSAAQARLACEEACETALHASNPD